VTIRQEHAIKTMIRQDTIDNNQYCHRQRMSLTLHVKYQSGNLAFTFADFSQKGKKKENRTPPQFLFEILF
jgi:hypothetical protein